MLKVVGCVTGAHDMRLVILAAVICGLAAITSVELLRHACERVARARILWIAVAAIAGGSGIWATHFVAMLAFEPGVPHAYDLALTASSLIYAISLTGFGLALAATGRSRAMAALGGAVLGCGIAVMHFVGMRAFQAPASIVWDPGLAAVSIGIGVGLGALALPLALSRLGPSGRLGGALILLAAICGLHFTAMAAVTIVPDPGRVVPEGLVTGPTLAGGVALVSVTILLLACAALNLDIRDRHNALERSRLQSLANAAVEGMVVYRDDVIVSANESFAGLVGIPAADLVGAPLAPFLPALAARPAPDGVQDAAFEAELHPSGRDPIPVECIARPILYGHQPHYAVAIRDLRARRQAERQIHFLAHHDSLTGLANRTSFGHRLDQEFAVAAARGEKVAVLCLDLDRFKEVNDLFGHATGDTLLIDVADKVSALLDEGQLMARLGGDEFAILARCRHPAEAGRLAEAVLGALAAESQDPARISIATSIGIALFPDDATERTLLLTNADTALYRAKSEGRGTFRFFEQAMGSEVRERRQLEHDLQRAVALGQMNLVYQPLARVGSSEVIGFEVLLRWLHPVRGWISPAVFIPVAEECGAMLGIGEWVLREACREAARWSNPLPIAVNVSAVQIHAPHFATRVQEILLQTGLKPGRLEIEITETALIRDPSRAQATLRLLKSLGVHIAMDDFGTGYSSLSNLRAYPFDKIKIDRSFVRRVDENPQAAAIVRSVIGLGHGLGLPVVAEGVETEAEMRFLEAERCDSAQGYLIGRPAPIAAFAAHTRAADAPPPAAALEDAFAHRLRRRA
ncbi:EAL domain-containing protein [Methylobacterium organophilum]|uniref:Signaling protein n=1 Tax=Methylobacterium organophilum TaxID=410 RepID=A0ABQ4TDU7_METOR|nr:EAL domain-containing protein [Methylobacterium organophilum]GJE29090.1 putative signaling protein [Methylobacterium organophilum]